MGDSIRDLFINLKLGGNAAESLEKVDDKVEGLIEKFKGFAETVAAAYGLEKLHSFIEGQAKLAADIKDSSDQLGVNAQKMQELGYAASMSGSSVEGMNVSLKFLSRNMNAASSGSAEAAAAFSKYHIALKNADGSMRDAGDVVYDVADAVKSLPPGAERVGLAMKLMGRGGAQMVPVLAEGREGLEKLAQEARATGGVFSQEYLDAADKADDATVRMSFAWRGAKSALAGQLMPAFTDFTNWLTKHITKLSDVTKNTTIVRTAMVALGFLVAAKVGPAFAGLAKSIAGVSAEAGIMETAMGLTELLAIVAAVAALALVFDDLFAMFEGKDSLIGDTIDAIFGVGETKQIVDDLTAAWDEFGQSLSDLGIEVPDIARAVEDVLGLALLGVATTVRTAIKLMTTFLHTLAQVAQGAGMVGKMMNDFSNGDDKAVWAGAKKIQDLVGQAAADAVDGVGAAFSMAPTKQRDTYGDSPDAKKRAAQYANAPRPIVHIQNNIHGVKGDPKSIAAAAAQGTKDGLDDYQNDNAYEAFALPEDE